MNPNPAEKKRAAAAPKRATRPTPGFDTLKVSESLKKAEFEDQQAMTLVEIIQEAQAGLATRADMEKMETGIRHDMEKMETGIRHDMEKMETGIRHDMEKMETGIRHDMEKMETGIRKDMGAGFHNMEKMMLEIRKDMEKMELGIHRDIEASSKKTILFVMSSIIGAAAIISTAILYSNM